MTWERRRPALRDRLRGESGPIGEPGRYISKAVAVGDFEGAKRRIRTSRRGLALQSRVQGCCSL